MDYDKETLAKVIVEVRKELLALKARKNIPPPIQRQNAIPDLGWLQSQIAAAPPNSVDRDYYENALATAMNQIRQEEEQKRIATESYYAMLEESIRLKEYELHVLESLL